MNFKNLKKSHSVLLEQKIILTVSVNLQFNSENASFHLVDGSVSFQKRPACLEECPIWFASVPFAWTASSLTHEHKQMTERMACGGAPKNSMASLIVHWPGQSLSARTVPRDQWKHGGTDYANVLTQAKNTLSENAERRPAFLLPVYC